MQYANTYKSEKKTYSMTSSLKNDNIVIIYSP